jgi:hypothetical protein
VRAKEMRAQKHVVSQSDWKCVDICGVFETALSSALQTD